MVRVLAQVVNEAVHGFLRSEALTTNLDGIQDGTMRSSQHPPSHGLGADLTRKHPNCLRERSERLLVEVDPGSL
jgi:hypothetical protein